MSVAFCECPNCRRQFTVDWDWERISVSSVCANDGEVVTDSCWAEASGPAYERNVICPSCGELLVVEHEMEPVFYAFKGYLV